MIKLLPSRNVKKLTGIDYSVLEWILNKTFQLNFKQDFDYNIEIHKSRTHETSYVWLEREDEKYTILLDCSGNLRYTIESILHELRHVLQHSHFESKMDIAFRTYREYYNSPEEKDARRFERLGTPVIRMYEAFEKSKEVFDKYQLGTTL